MLKWRRIKETGGLEEVLLRFVINIWNATESCKDFSIQVREEVSRVPFIKHLSYYHVNNMLEVSFSSF